MEKNSHPTKVFKKFLRFLKDNNAYISFFNNIELNYSFDTFHSLFEATRYDFYLYYLDRMFYFDIELDRETNRYVHVKKSLDPLVDFSLLYEKWFSINIIKEKKIKNKPQPWFNNYSKPASYKR